MIAYVFVHFTTLKLKGYGHKDKLDTSEAELIVDVVIVSLDQGEVCNVFQVLSYKYFTNLVLHRNQSM